MFEVLSPSAREQDLRVKREECRMLATVDTIVFVDPDAETTSVNPRLEGSWNDTVFAMQDVAFPSLAVTIPHGETYARD